VGGESPFERAIPVLPSLDVARTVAFYEGVLDFVRRHLDADYAIVVRDAVEIHFWRCTDPRLAEASGCRIGVTAIAPLYEAMRGKGSSTRTRRWPSSRGACGSSPSSTATAT
jgi:hypothetical protein